MRIAVPLYGKMSFRSFHTKKFINEFMKLGLEPVYYIEPGLKKGLDEDKYSRLFCDETRDMYSSKPILNFCEQLRRFLNNTETAELRFRDKILDMVFQERPMYQMLSYSAFLNILRKMRFLAPLTENLENNLSRTNYYMQDFKKRDIKCTLTPGVGSYGFLNEAVLAREAKRFGLKVISTVTNYDNIVNRGYRGFFPDYFAVWSEQMAQDAVRLLRIPAKRVEITGPVPFDRYFSRPKISREQFLKSCNLNPDKKTIFYAGDAMVTHYYDFLKIIKNRLMVKGRLKDYNLAIRPLPHNKVLSWYGMDALKELLSGIDGVYISDPHKFSADSFMPLSGNFADEELDELHCLFQYCDVLINTYSTVSLEAAINDLPTIHMGYEAYSYGLRYPSFIKFCQKMTHNRNKLRLAAARTANNEDELIKYLEMYLNNKSQDKENRYKYALSECEFMDGKSSERLASLVKKVIG